MRIQQPTFLQAIANDAEFCGASRMSFNGTWYFVDFSSHSKGLSFVTMLRGNAMVATIEVNRQRPGVPYEVMFKVRS